MGFGVGDKAGLVEVLDQAIDDIQIWHDPLELPPAGDFLAKFIQFLAISL